MNRKIVDFRQDEEAHWVAMLDCGHPQHTRHDPPLVERDWARTSEGRASRIGESLDCLRCDRHELPDDVVPFHLSDVFTEESLPEGLQHQHQTKAGLWARIDVLEGAVLFREFEPFDGVTTLTPDAPGIIVPEVPHEVAWEGPFRIQVQFFKVHREG